MFRILHDDYEDHGVPILKASDIEFLALEFLEKFFPDRLDRPPTPIIDILLEISTKNNVYVDLRSDLGIIDSKKVLGIIKLSEVLSKNEIYIDKSLLDNPEDPRLKFTIAHEIGHLVLHSKKKLSLKNNPNDIITRLVDFIENFNPKPKKDLKTPEDWLDYQANTFAASLLMPVPALKKEICNLAEENGFQIPKNGRIRVDNIFLNGEAHSYIRHLRKKFNVSNKAMNYRLNKLYVEKTSDFELGFYRESNGSFFIIDY